MQERLENKLNKILEILRGTSEIILIYHSGITTGLFQKTLKERYLSQAKKLYKCNHFSKGHEYYLLIL